VPDYLLALLVLDATGARVGELEAATQGDLDEHRKAWLVRAAVAKTRRSRWVELPDDLFAAIAGHAGMSLLHRQRKSWATIGERVGQRSKLVTADTHTHAIGDGREVDRAQLLERVRTVPSPVPPSTEETASLAGAF
jgi:integrase